MLADLRANHADVLTTIRDSKDLIGRCRRASSRLRSKRS
jgi:hypothetical protein